MKLRTVLLGIFLIASSAHSAELAWLPGSHHQQYLTHGLFLDEQTTLALRDGSRAWGSLGAALAVLEVTDWATHPQLVFRRSVDTSFRVVGGPLDLRAETFDARVGISLDLALKPDLRLKVGLTHLSGHAADGIADLALFAPNLGRDVFEARVVYDGLSGFRLGATLTPVISSDPGVLMFGANQFAEWFPFGAADDSITPTPYLAAGVEEYGVNQLDVSYHIQLGIYYGSHVKADTAPAVRFVAGYYNGADLRLKPATLRNSKTSFPYLGFMLHL